MHTFSETGPGVPAFLAKLWRLVEDPLTDNLISWSPDGKSFIIQNQAQFARELLPLNYKHNNMASFIRQLNMYGFHKITSIDNGGLKFDRDDMEFSHSFFQRNHPYLLEHIKRKIAHPKVTEEKSTIKPETVNKVLTEVKMMRGRQDNLDTRFSAMKQENEALWREIAVLRQKHMKQQQIVNKLIQFLVTIVQPQRTGLGGMGGKRRFQLMINDTPQSSKMRRTNESEGSGPIIHELSEELLDDVAEANDLGMDLSPAMSVEEMSPQSVTSPNNSAQQNLNEEIIDAMQYPNYYTINTSPNSGGDGDAGGGGISGENSNQSETTTTNQNNLNFIEDLNDELNVFDEANILTTPMARREMEKNENLKRMQREQKKNNSEDIVLGNPNGNRGRNVKTQKIPKAKKENNGGTGIGGAGGGGGQKPGTRSSVQKNQQRQVSESTTTTAENLSENAGENPFGVNIKMEKLPMYANSEDFMSAEMPRDLFDDENSIPEHPDSSPMIGGINLDTNPYPQQPVTQAASGSNNNAETASTDAAGNSSTGTSQNSKDDWALSTTAKPDDVFKLSTPADFDQHLDSFQGELDSLKDILRSDGISVDASTLLGEENAGGILPYPNLPLIATKYNAPTIIDLEQYIKLFADSDILSTYGLAMTEKKLDDPYNSYGSELMTYQPTVQCDLSELLDEEATTPAESALGSANQYLDKTNLNSQASSVLNTPVHEEDFSRFK